MNLNNLRDELFNVMLATEGAIPYLADTLDPDEVGDLFGKQYQDIYGSLLDYCSSTGLAHVDPNSFFLYLDKENSHLAELLQKSGIKLQFEKWKHTINTAPVADISVLIKHELDKKQKIKDLEQMLTILRDEGIKTPEDKERYREYALKVSDVSADAFYDPYAGVETGDRFVDLMDSIWTMPPFLATPFKALNRAIGYRDDAGFLRSGLHCVASASGEGKTIFSQNLMVHWVKSLGLRCFYANYEVPKSVWDRQLFAQLTGVNPWKNLQDNGKPNSQAQDADKVVRELMKEWKDLFMVRHDQSSIYYDDFDRQIREIHKQTPIDAIFIDTINSLYIPQKRRSRWEEFGEMATRMERLGLDTGICIVFTAQENRDRRKEHRSRASQADMGGSITLVEKSSAVIHLRRVKIDDDMNTEMFTELDITKGRIVGSEGSKMLPRLQYNDDWKSFFEYEMPTISDNDDSQEVDDLLDLDD